jgi:hypothetical protein
MHAPDQLVTGEVCRTCALRQEGDASIPDAASCVTREEAPCAIHVQKWAVGITTAPRRQPTLARSLKSLAEAGWEEPRLFAEPDVEIPPHLPVSRRDIRLGAFPNWYLGLTELVLREPLADAYLMCQDDVLLARNLRSYLERTLWPSEKVGVVSAYCPSHYEKNEKPGFQIEVRGWDTWGALAYIFPNPSARALLCDPLVVNHRHHGPAAGMHHIDCVVGSWCLRNNLPYFVHAPSLAQHIGATSTIWRSGQATGRRRAAQFVERID